MKEMKKLNLGKVKVVTFNTTKTVYGGDVETYLCSSYTTLVNTTLQNQSHNGTTNLSADTDCIASNANCII